MKTYLTFVLLLLFLNVEAQRLLSGNVIDFSSSEPIVGASIYIPELNIGTYTNEKGFFEFKSIPPGNFSIQISFVGYETVVQNINTNHLPNPFIISLDQSVVKSPEVVITAGRYSSQHENAIQIMAINSEDIRSESSPAFMAKIAEIPGVDMISKGIGVTKPVIRGLSMTNILLLNNGIRMENFQFSVDHPFVIDEYGIDKVEIIKGPASLLYGSDAVGGVINVLPEKFAPRRKILSDYALQYHSNTNGFGATAGIKGTGDDFSMGIRIGAKSHEDFHQGGGDIVPNSRFNNYNLKISSGWSKNFGNFKLYFENTDMKLGMTVPPAIDMNPVNERYNKIWYQDLNNTLLSSNNTFFLANSKIIFNLAYMSNNRKLQTSALNSEFTEVDMLLNTYSLELKNVHTFNKNFELSTGIQSFHKQNTNLDAPEHVLPDYKSTEASIFGLLQYNYNHTINLQMGARFDYKQMNIPAQSDEDMVLEALNKEYDNLSFSGGGTYYLTEHLLVRANFASAYRNPNVAELTQAGGHGIRYELGDRDLNAQRSYETDFSIHYHINRMSLDFSAYNNQIFQYIFLSPTNDTINLRRVYKYMQQDANIKGAEIVAELAPFDFLHMKLAYDYIIAIQSDGDYLPLIPQNKIKPSFKFLMPNYLKFPKLSFIVSGVYAFEQNHPSIYETFSPHYFLINLGFSGKMNLLKSKFEFSINVNNLLDEYYIDHLSTLKDLGYGNIGRNLSINLRIPLELK